MRAYKYSFWLMVAINVCAAVALWSEGRALGDALAVTAEHNCAVTNTNVMSTYGDSLQSREVASVHSDNGEVDIPVKGGGRAHLYFQVDCTKVAKPVANDALAEALRVNHHDTYLTIGSRPDHSQSYRTAYTMRLPAEAGMRQEVDLKLDSSLVFTACSDLKDCEQANRDKPLAITVMTASGTPVMPSRIQCSDGIGGSWWDAGPDGMCHPRDVSYTKPMPPPNPPPSLEGLFTAGVSSFVMCGYVDDKGLAQPLTAKALRQGRP